MTPNAQIAVSVQSRGNPFQAGDEPHPAVARALVAGPRLQAGSPTAPCARERRPEFILDPPYVSADRCRIYAEILCGARKVPRFGGYVEVSEVTDFHLARAFELYCVTTTPPRLR